MKTDSRALISVVVPVFNGEKYLKQAIDSVLAQDYRPFEIVIVDDGSTDRTAEVAHAYALAGTVRYHFQSHQGLAAARNAGIRLARGDVIAFLDADDLYEPGKLTKQMAVMEGDSGIEMVLGRARQFITPDLDEAARQGLRIMQEEVLSQLPNSSLIRRSALERVGPFDSQYQIAADMDWCIRALDAQVRIGAVHELVYLRRIHASNQGRTAAASGDAARLRVIKAGLDRRRSKGTARIRLDRISVAIAAYVADDYPDCERYLRQALDTVLGQRPAPLEVIVAFGPAQSGLEAVMDEYRDKVTFIHEPRPGDAPARNLAIRMSSGDMLASVDTDDYWAKDKLRLQLAALEQDPALEAVFTHAQEFYEPGQPGQPARLGDVLPAHIPASMLIKRQSFLRVGYYDERYTVGAAVDWFARAQELELRMVTLPEVLLFRRMHSQNQGRRMHSKQSEYLHVLKTALDRRRGGST